MTFTKSKKIWSACLLLCVVVLGLIIFKKTHAPLEAQQTPVQKRAVAELVLSAYKQTTSPVFASGVVKSADQITLQSEVNAPVVIVHKRIGDPVVSGEPIVTFSQIDLANQIAQAAASVDRAQASYEAAAAPARQGDLDRTQASVVQAQAALTQLRLSREQTVLTNTQTIEAAQNTINAFETDALTQLRSGLSNLSSALVAATDAQINFFNCTNDVICSNIARAKETTIQTAYGVFGAGRWNSVSVGSLQSGLVERVNNVNAETADAQQLVDLLKQLKQAQIDARETLNLVRAGLDSHLALDATPSQKAAIEGARSSIEQATAATDSLLQRFETVHGGALADGTPKKLDEVKRLAKRAQLILDAQILAGEAAVEGAQASLDALLEGPRDIDLEPLRRAVLEAQAGYNSLLSQARKYTVSSPFEGTILSLPLVQGQLVNPGAVIATISNPAILEVSAYVSSDVREHISYHDDILVDDLYHGVINAISSGIDPTTGKVELTIGIVDPAPGLTVGEVVHVAIIQKQASTGYLVPFSAVETLAGGSKVYYNDHGYARGVWVETGAIVGDRIEIFLPEPRETILQNVRGIEEGESLSS